MDTSELRFGSVQNLYLELETLPLTEPFRMHLGPWSATGTHNPKYLNQFWMVLHETFVSIVSQKQALLWKFHVKPSRIGQDI